MAMFVHGRILRPFLGMNLLFMSLPLVLGGYGRNAFINLGFALANSAMFYGAIHLLPVSRQFWRVLSPSMSAWCPVVRLRSDRNGAVGTDPDLTADHSCDMFQTSHRQSTSPAAKPA